MELLNKLVRAVVRQAIKQSKQSVPVGYEKRNTCMMFAMTLCGSGGRTSSPSWLSEQDTRHKVSAPCREYAVTHSPPPTSHPRYSSPLRASITPLQPLMQPVAGRGNKPALVTAVTAGVILMVVCAIDCFLTRSGGNICRAAAATWCLFLHCPCFFFLYQEPLK